MGVISKDNKKITLYYHSATRLGKQTLGYVEASKRKLLPVDISKTKVTGTQWAEIADNLNMEVSDLIDREHPDFVKKYGAEPIDLDQHDWMKILEKNPEVLTYPIVVNGNEYLQIRNPSDFAKYLGIESADPQKSYKEPE